MRGGGHLRASQLATPRLEFCRRFRPTARVARIKIQQAAIAAKKEQTLLHDEKEQLFAGVAAVYQW